MALLAQAALVSLYQRAFVAGGPRDHAFHRDTWRVLATTLADIKTALREPMSPAMAVVSTVYPDLFAAYGKIDGALGTANHPPHAHRRCSHHSMMIITSHCRLHGLELQVAVVVTLQPRLCSPVVSSSHLFLGSVTVVS